MWLTVIVAIALVGLLFAGMAIGVLLGGKPVKGSCGGLGAAGVQGECDICGRRPDDCGRDGAGRLQG